MREVISAVRANQAANEAFDEVAFEKLGINRTDGRCLDIIENQGPMTAGRLAELSGLTTAAVTAVLDRIERAGYARRVRDERDRRQVIVDLTPEFKERAERIWAPLGKDGFAIMERLSVDDLNVILDFFRRGREINERHAERLRELDLD